MTLTEFLLTRIAEDEAAAVRWAPARAWAKCVAERRLVEAHSDIPSVEDQEGGWWPDCPDCRQSQPCNTLRTIALQYVDHPDYQQEWAA